MFDGDDDIYNDAACHNTGFSPTATQHSGWPAIHQGSYWKDDDGESVGINLHQGEHADDGDE